MEINPKTLQHLALKYPLSAPEEEPHSVCLHKLGFGALLICTVTLDNRGIWWDMSLFLENASANFLDIRAKNKFKKLLRMMLIGAGKVENDIFKIDKSIHLRRPLSSQEIKLVSNKLEITLN